MAGDNYMFSIKTRSGGTIDLGVVRDRFHGLQAMIHLDQSDNMRNGEDECSVMVSVEELNDLHSKLTSFLELLKNNYGIA